MAESTCAKEGEEWHPFLPSVGYISCCKDLVGTSKWLQNNLNSKCFPGPPGDSGFCVKCGDGKCDTKNLENSCICPKDCK